MKKVITVAVVGVFLAAFAIGAVAPNSHAVLPKEIKCWHECLGGHYLYCCKYSAPGVGSWTECEDTGYLCAF